MKVKNPGPIIVFFIETAMDNNAFSNGNKNIKTPSGAYTECITGIKNIC
jgi:hypothetical protein